MKPKEITVTHAIHCATKSEFDRIVDLFQIHDSYLNWDIYEHDTVLYPRRMQYGDINGYCKEKNFTVVKSEEL